MLRNGDVKQCNSAFHGRPLWRKEWEKMPTACKNKINKTLLHKEKNARFYTYPPSLLVYESEREGQTEGYSELRSVYFKTADHSGRSV
jgi:hypothetical protein